MVQERAGGATFHGNQQAAVSVRLSSEVAPNYALRPRDGLFMDRVSIGKAWWCNLALGLGNQRAALPSQAAANYALPPRDMYGTGKDWRGNLPRQSRGGGVSARVLTSRPELRSATKGRALHGQGWCRKDPAVQSSPCQASAAHTHAPDRKSVV